MNDGSRNRPFARLIQVQLLQNSSLKINAANAGQLQQVQGDVGEFSCQSFSVEYLFLPLKMLEKFRYLDAQRHGQVLG